MDQAKNDIKEKDEPTKENIKLCLQRLEYTYQTIQEAVGYQEILKSIATYVKFIIEDRFLQLVMKHQVREKYKEHSNELSILIPECQKEMDKTGRKLLKLAELNDLHDDKLKRYKEFKKSISSWDEKPIENIIHQYNLLCHIVLFLNKEIPRSINKRIIDDLRETDSTMTTYSSFIEDGVKALLEASSEIEPWATANTFFTFSPTCLELFKKHTEFRNSLNLYYTWYKLETVYYNDDTAREDIKEQLIGSEIWTDKWWLLEFDHRILEFNKNKKENNKFSV